MCSVVCSSDSAMVGMIEFQSCDRGIIIIQKDLLKINKNMLN